MKELMQSVCFLTIVLMLSQLNCLGHDIKTELFLLRLAVKTQPTCHP